MTQAAALGQVRGITRDSFAAASRNAYLKEAQHARCTWQFGLLVTIVAAGLPAVAFLKVPNKVRGLESR
jgi:hypothetical protein